MKLSSGKPFLEVFQRIKLAQEELNEFFKYHLRAVVREISVKYVQQICRVVKNPKQMKLEDILPMLINIENVEEEKDDLAN